MQMMGRAVRATLTQSTTYLSVCSDVVIIGSPTIWCLFFHCALFLLTFIILRSDTEGVAIILCESELENKYRDLVQGTTPLESSLHTNLTEHLNSEIGLGTITDVKTAQEWLLRSFLYRRIQKNPQHYNIGKDDRQSWQDRMDSIVMDSIEQLRETELVTYSPRDGELSSTEFGDIMSKVKCFFCCASHII
jgi:ATP-dependent DNA helicase HFM1/MER3